MNKVVIIGSSNNYNELGLVRSFGVCGIKPYGIIICAQGKRKDWLHQSKYWKKVWFVSNADNAIKCLMENFSKEEEKPVLTTPVDYVMQIIDNRYDELSKNFLVQSINKKQGEINKFTNKLNQAVLTRQLGFETLETEVLDLTGNGVVSTKIDYPIIFKPVAGGEGSKDDITFCWNEKEKNEAIEKFRRKKYTRILCQRYLYDRTEIIAYGALNKCVGLCSYTVLKNKRQWPPFYGVGSLGILVTEKAILDYVDRLYHAIMNYGYDGPIDTDILLDNKTGKLYLSEYNWRPGGRNYTSLGTKIYSIVLWYYSKIGEIPNGMKIHNEENGMSMNDATDFNYVINGQVGFKEWIKDFKGAGSHALWFRDDLMPTIRPYLFMMKNYILKRKSEKG